MFDAFPAERRTELTALAERYGAPLVHVADLGGGLFDPLHRADGRTGEVCFVVRRADGRILTAVKTIYPAGAYRLLTGGLRPGESILDAVRRETREETALETAVRRFLAAIAYRRDGAVAFATFAFLLDETGGTLENADPHEGIADFRAVRVDDLEEMARFLASLPDVRDPAIGGSWRDWGRFRAIVHRAVRDALR